MSWCNKVVDRSKQGHVKMGAHRGNTFQNKLLSAQLLDMKLLQQWLKQTALWQQASEILLSKLALISLENV